MLAFPDNEQRLKNCDCSQFHVSLTSWKKNYKKNTERPEKKGLDKNAPYLQIWGGRAVSAKRTMRVVDASRGSVPLLGREKRPASSRVQRMMTLSLKRTKQSKAKANKYCRNFTSATPDTSATTTADDLPSTYIYPSRTRVYPSCSTSGK